MNKQGKICTGIGLLLLAAALVLAVYNFWSDARAGTAASSVLKALGSDVEENRESRESGKSRESRKSRETRETGRTGAPSEAPSFEEARIPDYVLNPEMPMPEEEIDGEKYIGILDLPALSLSLPVISGWSYPALRIAPCRYSGSAYLGNLVVAAHNYQSHFGKLGNLSPGDRLSFTDVEGNEFQYKVAEIETLSPYATEEMAAGDWDLTLFTCTVGGQSRVVVRCEETEHS